MDGAVLEKTSADGPFVIGVCPKDPFPHRLPASALWLGGLTFNRILMKFMELQNS